MQRKRKTENYANTNWNSRFSILALMSEKVIAQIMQQ